MPGADGSSRELAEQLLWNYKTLAAVVESRSAAAVLEATGCSAPKAAATPSAAAVPVPVAAVKAELPAARMPGLDE